MQSFQTDEPRIAIPAVANHPSAPIGEVSALSVASPASVAVRPPVAVDPSAAPAIAPILVADDDPDDRFFIRRLIAKTGTDHPVRTFDDGTEVVNFLGAIAAAGPDVRKRAPRLLFLDLKMTGLGGFGFLQWLREQKSALPMTVVVLSNSAEPADVAQAMALGAHRYLVKYPSVQTFSTIIRSVYPAAVPH